MDRKLAGQQTMLFIIYINDIEVELNNLFSKFANDSPISNPLL